MKRTIAALLAALLLALPGCGKAELRALDTAPEARTAVETTAPDWDAAYAAHAPEDVVFTVGTEAVTWQELFYQLAYCTAALESSSGVTVSDWSMEMVGENGQTVPVGDYILSAAVSLLQQYHVIHENLNALGLELSEEGQARVEAFRQTTITEQFAGDEAAFLAHLESLYASEELWRWQCEVDELYNEGFAFLYGEGGRALSEGEVLAYGESYGYVGIKQIYLYKNTDPSGDSGEVVDSDPMSLMLSELSQWKNEPEALEKAFDKLYEQHNENLSLANYPDGRAVWPGDVDETVYQTALAMVDYEYAIVSLEEADVLLLRLPLRPDMDVFYDGENQAMYSLRYYAAWQAYTDRIHGAGGWMEQTPALPVSPFEGFALTDVF